MCIAVLVGQSTHRALREHSRAVGAAHHEVTPSPGDADGCSVPLAFCRRKMPALILAVQHRGLKEKYRGTPDMGIRVQSLTERGQSTAVVGFKQHCALRDGC